MTTPAVIPAEIERLLDPARISGLLANATIEELGLFFAQARELGARAWMAMSVCVGIAQERAGRGDDVLGQLSQVFGLHRSRIARLGRIYRELLRERVEQQGEAATFLLPEQSWYEVAVEAGPILSRSPDDLLADAEHRKMQDPRYSIRRWKDDLGLDRDDDSLDGELRKIIEMLSRLASTPDDVIERLTSRSEYAPTIRAAHVALHRIDAGEDVEILLP